MKKSDLVNLLEPLFATYERAEAAEPNAEGAPWGAFFLQNY